MFRIIIAVLTLFTYVGISQNVYAQRPMNEQQYEEYSTPSEDEVKYDDEVTGVEVIWKTDGSGDWEKLIATAESKIRFGDRSDIRQAKKKASMRAKAMIAKFLKERINSSDVQDNMTKIMAEHNGTSESETRKEVETLTEKIENSANAILKGVLTLQQKVNKSEKYVMVKLGMSRKTMRAADNLRNNINRDLDVKQGRGGNTNGRQRNQGGTEVHRSRNYDNF